MNPTLMLAALQAAGGCHFITLVCACCTPIPRNWELNLAALPLVHRRFAVAQNLAVGAVIAFCGAVSLFAARELLSGSLLARFACAGIGLWWGGRLFILPWLRVWPELRSNLLRAAFVLLHLECALFASGYLYLAVRPV